MKQKKLDRIIRGLKVQGYGGLVPSIESENCSCSFEDLFPCGHNCLIGNVCVPAYEHSDGTFKVEKEVVNE